MPTYELYNGKVELEQDRWHRYFLTCKAKKIDHVRVDGVTTPLNRIAKEHLVPWAAKMSVKELGYYDRDKWDEAQKKYVPIAEEKLTEPHQRFLEIHSKIVLMEAEQYYKTLKDAKGAHRRSKDEAANLGSLGHKWVEKYIRYKINKHAVENKQCAIADVPFPEHLEMPEMPAFPVLQNTGNAFLKWESEHHVIFTESEKRIASVKYLYAGTEDWEAIVDDELAMGDLKTSNQIAMEYRFQVAAYQNAREEEFKNRKYASRIVLRVGKDLVENEKGEKVVEFEAKRYGRETYKRDFGIFLHTLNLHRGLNEVEAEIEKEKSSYPQVTPVSQ